MYSDKVETFHGWKVKEESGARWNRGTWPIYTRCRDLQVFTRASKSNLIRCRRGSNRISRSRNAEPRLSREGVHGAPRSAQHRLQDLASLCYSRFRKETRDDRALIDGTITRRRRFENLEAKLFGINYILIFCIAELILFDEIPIGLHDEITWRPYIEFRDVNELVNGLAQCFLAEDGIAIEFTWSLVPCRTSRPRGNRWSMRACSTVDPGGSRTPSLHEPRLTNEAMIGL